MRRIYVFTLLASAISSSAFAQSPQPEYSNPTTGQPYAVQVTPAQQNYVLPPPHYIVPPYYVVPPPHYVAPPPHYVVRQGSDPAATPNASPPPAPWNSRGGGLLQGIFGGPTVTAHSVPAGLCADAQNRFSDRCRRQLEITDWRARRRARLEAAESLRRERTRIRVRVNR